MLCPFCKEEIQDGALKCKHCSSLLSANENIPLKDKTNLPADNSSGLGKDAVVPAEIMKWNWGAFFFNWIWGLGNKTYIALLALIPILNVVMMFVLGVKGSEWAWRNDKWESIEHFQRVQKSWAHWGVGLFIAAFVLIIIANMK
jgi:hypothetical protein